MSVKVLQSEMQTLNYEDYEVGDEFITPMVTVTETHVVLFAGLTGDWAMGHTCEHFCQSIGGLGEGTRMAHGMLVLAMGLGLFTRMGVNTYVKEGAYLGIDRWRCLRPVKIGDSIGARWKVLEKEILDKKPEWGKVKLLMTIVNQKGETVQVAEHIFYMPRGDRE